MKQKNIDEQKHIKQIPKRLQIELMPIVMGMEILQVEMAGDIGVEDISR